MLGEAPLASHLLYTQSGILKDGVPEERAHGIEAGLAWRHFANAFVVYIDNGVSKGMEHGIKAATLSAVPVEYRSLKKAPAVKPRPLSSQAAITPQNSA